MTSYARKLALLLFFLTLSHAVMIQSRNRNCCDIGSVSTENAGKLSPSSQRFISTQVTAPRLNYYGMRKHRNKNIRYIPVHSEPWLVILK